MARIQQKKRGQVRRDRKKIILIGTEGNNKTEKNYFAELGRVNDERYIVKFARGNSTDPVGVVQDTIQSYEAVCTDEGDCAFAVFDSDCDAAKQNQIDTACSIASRKGIDTVLSVPCFEIWFLQHFRRSTRISTNTETIEELKRYIPNYNKSMNIYDLLKDKQVYAIDNAVFLDNYHQQLKRPQKSLDRNPSSEVVQIVQLLTGTN